MGSLSGCEVASSVGVGRREPASIEACGAARGSRARTVGLPQRVLLPLTTSDLTPLRFSCSLERPDDPEADESGVGVPPDALGPLGVLDAPFGVRGQPGGAAEPVGVVVPRAAAGHVGVFLGRRAGRPGRSPACRLANVLVDVRRRSGPGTTRRRCRACRTGPRGSASSCRPAAASRRSRRTRRSRRASSGSSPKE